MCVNFSYVPGKLELSNQVVAATARRSADAFTRVLLRRRRRTNVNINYKFMYTCNFFNFFILRGHFRGQRQTKFTCTSTISWGALALHFVAFSS